jgi:hypothetical protein
MESVKVIAFTLIFSVLLFFNSKARAECDLKAGKDQSLCESEQLLAKKVVKQKESSLQLWLAPKSKLIRMGSEEVELSEGRLLIVGANNLKFKYLNGYFTLNGDFLFEFRSEDLSLKVVKLAGVIIPSQEKWSEVGLQPGFAYRINPLTTSPWKSPSSMTRYEFFKTLLTLGLGPDEARETWRELREHWSHASEQVQIDIKAVQSWQKLQMQRELDRKAAE